MGTLLLVTLSTGIVRVSRTEWDLERSARSKVLECSDTIRGLLETLRNDPTSILESYSGCRASVSTIYDFMYFQSKVASELS